MDPAVVAVIGAAVGGLAATANNLVGVRAKARSDLDQKRQEMLREACADFSTSLIRMRSLSWTLKELRVDGASGSADAAAVRTEIRTAHQESQLGFERVRMLSTSTDTQLAGRYSLRHAWAIWQEAESGIDPRAADYPHQTPGERFNEKLSTFYVESRRELGLRVPESVIAELQH